MYTRRLILLLIIVVLAGLPATPARAWGNLYAHPRINHHAFAQFKDTYGQNEKYERARIDQTLLLRGMGVVEPGVITANEDWITLSVAGWIEHGGFSADEPEAYAALRHFYDPLGLNDGAYHLTDQVPDSPVVNPQIDARTWAISHPENPYSWQRALQMYKLAMESPREREANLAYAFRSLGETMHLVADMAQPAHVRNDSHVISDPIEAAVTGEVVDAHASGRLDSRFRLRTDSADTLFESVARYTNAFFFSSDTIYNADKPYALPRNGEANYDSPSLSGMVYDVQDHTYYAKFDVGKVAMAQWTYSQYMLDMMDDPKASGYHVPAAFVEQQAKVLIPLAIQSNVILINMFFPSFTLNLETSLNDAGVVQYGGELVHVIENDPAWSEAQGGPGEIRYTGPAQLYLIRDGEQRKLLDLQFEGGVVRKPMVLDPRSVQLKDKDQLVLEILAGGRVIRSAELKMTGPQITALEPDHGLPDTEVTIIGRNFGAEQGQSSVTFAGDVAKVETWSDTEILVIAPDELGSGHVVVTVQGVASNSMYFTRDGEPTDVPDDATPYTYSDSPKKCFTLEPYIDPPWVFGVPEEGDGIGWACVTDDTLMAGNVPIRRNCPPPDDRTVFPYIQGEFDGERYITDRMGGVSGTYSPEGITLTIHYDEVSEDCPAGTYTLVFTY